MRSPHPLQSKSRDDARIEIALTIETPIVGGGVHVEQLKERKHVKPHDSVTPVRGASIRGQLRQWWRETTPDGDREREGLLWGLASQPSSVRLTVGDGLSITSKEAGVGVPNKSGTRYNGRVAQAYEDLQYGLFPISPSAGVEKPHPGVIGQAAGMARITLEAPAEHRAEVQRAVDAWLLLGGLGSRTRRGFGAVFGEGDAFAPERARTLLPHARFELGPSDHRTAREAQAWALQKLASFRQGPEIGRNSGVGAGRPGRSRWPEADLLRKITHAAALMHREPLVRADAFPRAAFGLPIVFHFQTQGDPPDRVLIPCLSAHPKATRMASPLILRPVRIGQGKYRALALILPHRKPPDEVCLEGQQGAWRSLVSSEEAQRIKPLSGSQDVLEKFLAFFAGRAK